MYKCKHCNKEFDHSRGAHSAHMRWCSANPYSFSNKEKVIQSKQNNKQIPWNKGKSGYHIKNDGVPGMLGKKHSDATKSLISEKARYSNHRRLRRGIINYNGIMLDSSWELALAQRLDELNIRWIRPEPIKWIDNDCKTHNYFPDFYLPDYNIFLDPKNPRAVAVQQEKINILLNTLPNLRIIYTLEECKSYVPDDCGD